MRVGSFRSVELFTLVLSIVSVLVRSEVMKLFNSLITAYAVLLLCCPPSRAATTNTPDATNKPDGNFDKQLDYRLRWNLHTLVGDYERNGRRDPKWDEYAKAGLSYFAQVLLLAGSAKMKKPL